MMCQRPNFSFYGFYDCVNLCTINWGEFDVDECETVILILARMSTLLHCASDRMRTLRTTAALTTQTSVLYSQLLLEDGWVLQSSVRRHVVLFG
jgi:hypothetical protein